MNNQAIIAKIDRVVEIPGANTIHVGVVLGESVIVSKEWDVGKVGVLFPVGEGIIRQQWETLQQNFSAIKEEKKLFNVGVKMFNNYGAYEHGDV